MATEVIPLHLVVDRVKGELATYAAQVGNESPTGKACGAADTSRALDIDFNAVTLELNTAVATRAGVDAEAGVIPLGTVTASAGVAANMTDTKSQKVTIGLTPLKPPLKRGGNIAVVDEQPLGIANTLLAVRRELLATSPTEPCLKPDKLDLEIVFGAKKDSSATFGVNLIVVSIGGGVSAYREDTHSIKIEAKLVGTPLLM